MRCPVPAGVVLQYCALQYVTMTMTMTTTVTASQRRLYLSTFAYCCTFYEAKCNLGKVKIETMLASGHVLGTHSVGDPEAFAGSYDTEVICSLASFDHCGSNTEQLNE